jgi:hypothetical protein
MQDVREKQMIHRCFINTLLHIDGALKGQSRLFLANKDQER